MEKVSSNYLLGSTAAWTASVRALESRREAPLFNDPWAEPLAGEEGMAWIETRPTDSVLPIVIRTRYFDDFLQRVTRERAIKQVGLLAAGLDTRAYRLSWPDGTTIYEVDRPPILERKEEILDEVNAQATCVRRAVAADLASDWPEALALAGFDPRDATVWLLEGILFYLANETIDSILHTVTGLSAPGSLLGFDIMNDLVLTSPYTRKWVEMQAELGAPWIGTMNDPQDYLQRLGWEAYLTQAGAEDANFGRWQLPVLPTLLPGAPHNWYVTAVFTPDRTFS
ncbi:MAG: SAM-dependent methyltransferase [Candidatus Promineifilaceae bacterium]